MFVTFILRINLFVRFLNGLSSLKIDHLMRSFDLKYYYGTECTYTKYYQIRAFFAQSIKYYSHSTTPRTLAALEDREW